MFMFGGIAFADEGAGQSGPSVAIGYDGVHLNYMEYVSGRVVDQDTGWQNGGFIEARYDNDNLFLRGNFDAVGSNSAQYKGALQNGTPLSMSTSERIYTTEFDAGYKALNLSTATLSPYLGIGYRNWERGGNTLPDYKEQYNWGFGAAGGNIAYKIHKLTLGLDAALLIPFSQKMNTNVGGTVDSATFRIKSELGCEASLPISYQVYSNKSMKMFVFGTPYYEMWRIGRSPTITLTQSGIPVTEAFEPKSHTDMYGVRGGVRFNFF